MASRFRFFTFILACACMALCCGAGVFAATGDVVMVEVDHDGVMHQISVERVERAPVFAVVQDSFAPASGAKGGIAECTVIASIGNNADLRSLQLVLRSGGGFVPSGAFEWQVGTGAQNSLYGKVLSRADRDGTSIHTISVITGLAKVENAFAAGKELPSFLRVYDKAGNTRVIPIPPAFLHYLATLTGA